MMKLLAPALRLLLICSLAAGTLAVVYKSTQARIEVNRSEEKARRLRWVMPDCPEVQARQDPDGGEFYAGLKDSAPCGWAVETRAKGYGGEIVILLGTDLRGRVTGFSILSHKETPGLGDKASQPAFAKQFLGLSLESLRLRKDSPEGAVDALTAATITSRAVTGGMREGVERILRLSGGAGSGAAGGDRR